MLSPVLWPFTLAESRREIPKSCTPRVKRLLSRSHSKAIRAEKMLKAFRDPYFVVALAVLMLAFLTDVLTR